MIVFSYKVNDAEAQEFFDYAGFKSRDMREPFERVLDFVRMFEAAVFESEGEVLLGERWTELSDDYLARKIAEWGPKPILRASDDLFLLAITEGRAYTTGVTYEVDAVSDRGFDYGEAHMSGTNRMVPRPWFGWTEDHEEYTRFVFEEWLDELREANARRGPAEPNARPEPPHLSYIYEGII